MKKICFPARFLTRILHIKIENDFRIRPKVLNYKKNNSRGADLDYSQSVVERNRLSVSQTFAPDRTKTAGA